MNIILIQTISVRLLVYNGIPTPPIREPPRPCNLQVTELDGHGVNTCR